MRRLIDTIIDNDDSTIKSTSKNIPEIINIIKRKEEPIKKVSKEKEVKVVKEVIKKEYNEKEMFWIKLFNKLGDKND